MHRHVTLNCVSYRVTEIDGQVMFEKTGGVWGVESRFCFEWRGAGWYLIDFEDSFGRIYVPHLVSAAKWLEQNYGVSYNNGVGKVRFLD